MTHILPQHPDLGTAKHSSISSALEMEQQHAQQRAAQQQQMEQHPQSPQNGHDGANSSAGPRKRKKTAGDGDESMSASEPRRLRRSHEACARCRSKKIKASAVG